MGDKCEECSTTIKSADTVLRCAGIYKCPSYSDVVKDVVVVKPKSKQNNATTKEDICKNVKPASLEVGIVQIQNIKDGGVVIRCKNKEDSLKIKEAAEKKLKKKYNIKVPELINPCIKIIGIDEEMDENELRSCILKQNSCVQHDNVHLSIKVLKKMKTKCMSIVELDPWSYDEVLKEGRLSIGWSVCRVFEYVNVFRCFKCAGFDHMAKDCVSDIKCLKCTASDHSVDVCESDSWLCQNCVRANTSLKLNLKTDHSPYDTSCPCFARKISAQKRRISFDVGSV
ncbi:zinc finger cchc-type superfamily [Holotrichia oblita]|uniref:Zinc finger cchc-type superfamily n=1 Tax=Holotrichia oblita TaxID=644536 RepID=A0ACB9TBS6_HOLOL|nr:zinc finger cchc-type superfamily [Holotrichia oblita]